MGVKERWGATFRSVVGYQVSGVWKSRIESGERSESGSEEGSTQLTRQTTPRPYRRGRLYPRSSWRSDGPWGSRAESGEGGKAAAAANDAAAVQARAPVPTWLVGVRWAGVALARSQGKAAKLLPRQTTPRPYRRGRLYPRSFAAPDLRPLSYSTVTDLARLRGWSTSQPRRTAMW
jgi:hypothetical protein